MRLWAETSYKQLEVPEDELFTVQHLQIEIPAYAPILASVTCAVCGESVMETRARVQNGQPTCISCASAPHYRLDGAGIAIEG